MAKRLHFLVYDKHPSSRCGENLRIKFTSVSSLNLAILQGSSQEYYPVPALFSNFSSNHCSLFRCTTTFWALQAEKLLNWPYFSDTFYSRLTLRYSTRLFSSTFISLYPPVLLNNILLLFNFFNWYVILFSVKSTINEKYAVGRQHQYSFWFSS